MSRMTIFCRECDFLCAEDNELNAEILMELLKIEGAECTICENGRKNPGGI